MHCAANGLVGSPHRERTWQRLATGRSCRECGLQCVCAQRVCKAAALLRAGVLRSLQGNDFLCYCYLCMPYIRFGRLPAYQSVNQGRKIFPLNFEIDPPYCTPCITARNPGYTKCPTGFDVHPKSAIGARYGGWIAKTNEVLTFRRQRGTATIFFTAHRKA